MTAVVNDALDRIETIWEAATPPDRTDVTYKRADRKNTPKGTAGNRQFYFEVGGFGTTGQRGAMQTERTWIVSAVLRLSEAGRNIRTFQEAIANESNLLFRLIEVDEFSGVSGLVGVETDEIEVEKDDNGDAIVTMTMSVHTKETDQ